MCSSDLFPSHDSLRVGFHLFSLDDECFSFFDKSFPVTIQVWEELTKKGKALINQREQMEAYAQDVINRYELGKKGLGIEEQKLVKDIVLGMLEIASKGAGAALGAKVGKTGFQ